MYAGFTPLSTIVQVGSVAAYFRMNIQSQIMVSAALFVSNRKFRLVVGISDDVDRVSASIVPEILVVDILRSVYL